MTVSFSVLYDCVFSRWSPAIGDPSLMGWATVAAYGCAAILCVLAFCREPEPRVRVFGMGLAMLLTALMINKQLDLQSALTATGRCISQIQGWYEDRENLQFRFIIGLLLASCAFGIAVFWSMRRYCSTIGLALLGMVILLCFIAVRAVGFHHFDALINVKLGTMRLNWALELGGIAMIALNGVWILFRRKKGPPLRNSPDDPGPPFP